MRLGAISMGVVWMRMVKAACADSCTTLWEFSAIGAALCTIVVRESSAAPAARLAVLRKRRRESRWSVTDSGYKRKSTTDLHGRHGSILRQTPRADFLRQRTEFQTTADYAEDADKSETGKKMQVPSANSGQAPRLRFARS